MPNQTMTDYVEPTDSGVESAPETSSASPQLAALQQLARQKSTPLTPDAGANKARAQNAASAQAALMLGANLGRAVDKGIVAMSGSQTLETDNQAYQNAVTAAYAPSKIAEQIAQSEAQDLAVTKQRQELELTDPTSQVNREFQKQLAPAMEKMGYAGYTPYMTIQDFTSGNGVFHGFFMADQRRNERESALKLALAEEKRANAEWDRRNGIQFQQALAKKRARRGGGSGGGGGGGERLTDFMSPEAWRNFSEDVMAKAEARGVNISDDTKAIIRAGGTNENMQRRAAELLKQFAGKEVLPQGEALSDAKKKQYADEITENYESAMHVQGALDSIDKLLQGLDPEEQKIVMQAALTGQGVWDLAKNFMGKVAGKVLGSDTERLNKLATQASVYIQQFKSMMVKEISGAQVAVAEYQRIANSYGANNFSDAGVFMQIKKQIQDRRGEINEGKFRNMPPDAMRYMINNGTVGMPKNAEQIYKSVYSNKAPLQNDQAAPAETGAESSGTDIKVDGKIYRNVSPKQLKLLQENKKLKIEVL